MSYRDIRTMNMEEGQKAESDQVFKRIGDLAYRNLGSLSRAGLFDAGKALIVGTGLRVEPSSGLTLTVPSGSVFQRFIDVIPCVENDSQTVTLDAASGSPRTDIIEAQIKLVTDKDDISQVATVATGTAIAITNQAIKRDIKHYLSARNQTNTTTPTVATAGILTGTVAIAGTIDLSEKYLINLSDGEDGSYQEIDCRGATPEATTLVEINSAINAATGRTMATVGGGSVGVLTGSGTSQTSYFQIQPPFTDTDKDALEVIYGLSIGGIYRYTYEGTNEWFKIAEIDMGASTTTVTSALIRNIDRKDTWTGNTDDILVHDSIYEPNISEWNKYSATVTYAQNDIAYIGKQQFVSLVGSNLNKYPITNPDYWEIVPDFYNILKDYQNAKVIWPGLKNIDNYRHADYEQFNFAGYYTNDLINYEAYKVRLDGSVVTGDSDLESIFAVGGGNEYFLLDTLAPDVVGTRTLPDLRGRVPRAVDDDGGTNLTEDVGVVQEDQGQAWQLGCAADDTGARDYWARSSNRDALNTLAGGNSNYTPIFFNTAQQGGATLIGAKNDGTNGDIRSGLETRVMNYTVGVPYVIVLKIV